VEASPAALDFQAIGEPEQAILRAVRFYVCLPGGQVQLTMPQLEDRVRQLVTAALTEAASRFEWVDRLTPQLLSAVCAYHVTALQRQTLLMFTSLEVTGELLTGASVVLV